MANNGNQSNNSQSQANNSNGGIGSSNTTGQQNRNGTGHNGQSNNGREVGNNKPTIPDEKENPDCPVCLNRVQNRAYTNSCLHEFCFPCIKEWSKSHNRCPVCREVYQKILHNIRSKDNYDEEPVDEPPDPNNGLLIMMGGIALLITPQNTGLYIINPMATPHGMHYSIQFYGPNQRIILPSVNPNMVIVTPDRIEQTLREMNARPHHPHHGRHPSYLRRHTRHRRRH